MPQQVLLCGGGAGLAEIQETLATSDWYEGLPFSRRPIINLLDINGLPNLILGDHAKELDHSFATALGLVRVGTDTLEGAPEEKGLKAKFAKLLQN